MNTNPKRQPLFRFILETSEGNNTIRHNRGKITQMQIIMWFLLEISCEKRNSLGATQFRDEREGLWTRRSHFFHIGTWVLMMLNSQSQDVHFFFFFPPIQTSNSCLPCPKPLPRLKGSKQAVYLQGWSVQRQALKPRAPHGYTPQPAPAQPVTHRCHAGIGQIPPCGQKEEKPSVAIQHCTKWERALPTHQEHRNPHPSFTATCSLGGELPLCCVLAWGAKALLPSTGGLNTYHSGSVFCIKGKN